MSQYSQLRRVAEQFIKFTIPSIEDPTPHFGEFTPEQLEEHLFYKFKNKENCIKFCDSK